MDQRRSELFDRLGVVGKAFASPRRLELVDILAQGERTVESLSRTAGLGMSTVSAHLQVLKLANLVSTRREGTRVFYRLAGDDVAALYDSLRTVSLDRSADVGRALDAYLHVPGSAEVGLVTRDELVQALEAGRAVVLDVRPAEEFASGHIPGARNAPLERLAGLAEDLRSGVSVIAYCRGAFCVLAHDAVRILGALGVDALRLEDGMLEWRTHGHPIEVGA